MTGGLGREPEKYRLLLKLQVRTMQLDPRLRRRFDSSDLVQEAFLKAHLHREKFEGVTEAQFVKWLKRIVENVVRDKCREHKAVKRDVRREQDLQQVVSESSVRLEKIVAIGQAPPGQRLEQHERELRLAAALEQLPEDQRDAIILRHLHDLSLEQAAEQMNRSEKAVSHLVYRGRRTLRKILDANQ
jgi:RNA polymerase sigma-70 factor (ECF subfamily)